MKLYKKLVVGIVFMLIFAIQLTAYAANLDKNFASNIACTVSADGTVTYIATLPELPGSDDGVLYLMALNPYQYQLEAGVEVVGSCAITTNPVITFPVLEGTENTRLYSKFALAVNNAGAMTMISEPKYITNPEALAKNTKERKVHNLISSDGYILFLNGSSARCDIPKSSVTILCNNRGVANPYAIAQDSHPTESIYYMLNASDRMGVLNIGNAMSNFAATHHVDNYIVGNEVNVRKWNYMSWVSWEQYMREYEQAFRVVYNAVKSQNANARVFVCLDQNWDRNRPVSHAEYYEYIDGKDFLTMFASNMRSEGDIDWSVSIHPYTVPLTWAKFWDMSGCKDGAYCKAQVDSDKMLTFQNLGIFTQFMNTPEMLSPFGTKRHVIINEVGISNTCGGDVQAAALYASYYAAKTQGIEEIMYNRSNGDGVSATLIGNAVTCYQEMDGPNSEFWDQYAKSIIGITDWSQILR